MSASVDITTGNATDTGRERTENQDYFGFYESTSFGAIWIICDGMGGAAGGKIASTMAVEKVRDAFCETYADRCLEVSAVLSIAVEEANKAIFERAQRDFALQGMGTTVVILAIRDNQAHVAHVGDSRAYLIRDGRISRLTKDHTLVQCLIDEGAIAEEEAKNHNQSHILTRSVGVKEEVDVEVKDPPLEVQTGDYFVLCTDGLTGLVEDETIQEIALEFAPPKACQELIELANKRGGYDNITVQIVKIESHRTSPLEKIASWLKIRWS